MRPALATLGKLVLAYLLLATFWASAPMSATAFTWVAPPGAGAWASAPALLERVGLGTVSGALWSFTTWAFGSAGYWRDYAVVSVLGGVLLPVALTLGIGPRTRDQLGLRALDRHTLGLALVTFVVLLPVTIAIALHPDFREGLHEALARSAWFGISVPVGMIAEHFFFHGVLLAWLHPSGAFPPASELARAFVWPGRRLESGRVAGIAESLAGLAIPRSCVVPCLLSGPLFWAIHVGKTDGELWLSLPAGVVFAWLSYRTNGPVVPLLVHASVPITAALIVLATS